jgi:hypothetical protein
VIEPPPGFDKATWASRLEERNLPETVGSSSCDKESEEERRLAENHESTSNDEESEENLNSSPSIEHITSLPLFGNGIKYNTGHGDFCFDTFGNYFDSDPNNTPGLVVSMVQ